MSSPSPVYSAPFDAIADRYDETFTDSKIGLAQRSSVLRELAKAFRPGDRVLEIGCGTGVDACFLADRGVSVVACDSSPRMISVTRNRVKANGQEGLVDSRVLPADNIADLGGGENFDGAFSDFGALNCVEDLRKFASDLASLLRPGTTALLCLMGSCCWWEIAWYLAHGNPQKGLRRFKRGGVTARLADGAAVRVHYPSVRSLSRTFAPWFHLRSVKGIGISVPPSYLEHLAHRFPRLFALQERTDSLLGSLPGIRVLADHVLLKFERSSASSDPTAKMQ